MRRATCSNFIVLKLNNISIHALHAESDDQFFKMRDFIRISIHALHAESDSFYSKFAFIRFYFNPRSPCGERRSPSSIYKGFENFNPRSPCGERRGKTRKFSTLSIFQSTLSMRRATNPQIRRKYHKWISIHALHAESDRTLRTYWRKRLHFNPRSPCGERHSQIFAEDMDGSISIHALHAESDVVRQAFTRALKISIHALHAESDAAKLVNLAHFQYFNPRSPCGERLENLQKLVNKKIFQSTLSMRRATSSFSILCLTNKNFNPRSPCGERHCALYN